MAVERLECRTLLASLPYSQGFEGGGVGNLPDVSVEFSGSGTVAVTTTNSPRGAYHLKFDHSTDAAGSSQLVLALDLSSHVGADDLRLDFWLQILKSYSTLDVQFSGDGTTWGTIPSTKGLTTLLNSYTHFEVDLDAALATLGIAVDSNVYVKFLHSGQYQDQELTLDDLRVISVVGPRIITPTTVALDAPVLNVSFNEPIDPASFTASDISIMGPDGYAVTVIGESIPSIDNKTYSINFVGSLSGKYTFNIGPAIHDLSSNAMDQDMDSVFGETSGQDRYTGTIELGPLVAQTIPYQQGFDSESPSALAGWRFSVTGPAMIDVIETGSPYTGAGHLRFSQTTNGVSTAEAVLKLDLSSHVGATDLVLDFWQKAMPYAGAARPISVSVSGDGTTWKPVNISLPFLDSVYSHYVVNLSTALSGIALDSVAYVRFTSTSTSGSYQMALDQVRVQRGPSNQAPSLSTVSPLAGFEDTPRAITYANLLSASDEHDTGPIQFRVDNVLSGTLTKDGLPVAPGNTFLNPGESLIWLPNANQSGLIDAFTIRSFDGDLYNGNAVRVAINVSQVNDAPIFDNSGEIVLPTQLEDNFTPAEIFVDDLIAGKIIDIDPDSGSGIAIIQADQSFGSWQYKVPSFGWIDLSLKVDEALLLPAVSTRYLRFVPNANASGTATLTFRAWDRATGNAEQKVSIPAVGGTSPFSEASETISVTVLPVNDAPVLNILSTQLALSSILEDDTNNPGTLVRDLLANVNGQERITDVDQGALRGVAVVGASNIGGTWQYSLDDARTWSSFGLVDFSMARLLADNARIRFVPDLNFFGTVSTRLKLMAWDQTAGVNGQSMSVSVGGSNAFSIRTLDVSIIVKAVGDTPTVTNATTREDTISPPITIRRHSNDSIEITYFRIGTIIGGTLYRSDGVTPVFAGDFIPSTSSGSLDLRFKPSATYSPQGSFQVAASQDGATVAAQSAWATSIITIQAVALAPLISSMTTQEDTLSEAIIIDRNPTDGAEVTHFRIFSISGGLLFQSDRVTPVLSGDYLTYAQAQAGVHFLPALNSVLPGKFTVNPSDKGAGYVLYSTLVETTINVTPVNDPPNSIELSYYWVGESQAGANIGALAVLDIDVGDTSTLSTTDDRFEIVNRQLKLRPQVSLDYEVTPTVEVVVVAVDAGGLELRKTFTIFVIDVPEAPTAINISSHAVYENNAGALVGTLSVIDPDANDTHSLRVWDDRFEIVGQQLKLKDGVALDFEASASIDLLIGATDRSNRSLNQLLKISITDVNETPLDMTMSNLSLPENSAGIVIGSLLVADPDAGEDFTFVVSDDRFIVLDQQLQLKNGTSIDFETEPSIPVDITVSDRSGQQITRSFVLSVTNVNEAPTSIVASLIPVGENVAGAVVGSLNTIDPDSAGPFNYTVADPRFEIMDGELRLKAGRSLNFEVSATLSIFVTVQDADGASLQVPLVVSVLDRPELPTDVLLSRHRIFNNLPGAWVANIAVADEDRTNLHHFVIDSRFEVRNGELYLKAGQSIDVAAGQSLPLEIKVLDETAGGSFSRSFYLEVEDGPTNWQNGHQWWPNRFDVDADGEVTPLDALLIIVHLNAIGPTTLTPQQGGTLPPLFFDTSGDNAITPLDPLEIITFLNSGGNGEPTRRSLPTSTSTSTDEEHAVDSVFHQFEELLLGMLQEDDARKTRVRAMDLSMA